MKRKIFIIGLLLISILLTGCKNDNMDNIEIIVTNYPNEYILKSIYSSHSTIASIYPDGVDITKYEINEKQMKDFAKKDLFIYNGLIPRERQLALDLLAINSELKIIDTAYVLETDYSPEELWLNPSSLLMMSQNVRTGLKEYASSNYLKKDIDEAYESLKISLSELDAEYRITIDSTSNKTIVVADPALKYLEKFGLTVLCIDDNATQKVVSDAEDLIKNGKINYIYLFNEEEIGENTKTLLDTYKQVQIISLHKLDNITDAERSEKKDYNSISRDNLDLLKKELYQ